MKSQRLVAGLTAAAAAAVLAAMTACGAPAPQGTTSATAKTSASPSRSGSPSPSSSPTPSPTPSETPTPSAATPPPAAAQAPAAAPAPAVPAAPAAPQVPAVANVVGAWIPYGEDRKAQMAEYARQRYGIATWQLQPQAIVLHFTESGDDPWSTINYFGANQPNGGTYPQVCAHFVLGKDGTAYQLVPTDVMCRHTIGLNHVAIGIEVVQASQGNGSVWAEQQILNRPAQVGSLIRLVKSLQAQYGIPTDRIIGHGTANSDPQFLDLTGLRNDHSDWGWPSVQQFRDMVNATP